MKKEEVMPPPPKKNPVGFQKGRAKTGGMKKGTKRKKTIYQETVARLEEQQAKREALVAKTVNGIDYDKDGNVLGPDYGQTPLEFMLGLMRDRRAPTAFRAAAAKDAAPYQHPKLASIEVKQKSVTINQNIEGKSAKELSGADLQKLYKDLLDE